jgi:hypothetical protein
MRLRARTTIGSRGGLEMSKKKQEKKTQKKRITFKLEASEARRTTKGGGPRLLLLPLGDTSTSSSWMGNGRMIPAMIKWSITPLVPLTTS